MRVLVLISSFKAHHKIFTLQYTNYMKTPEIIGQYNISFSCINAKFHAFIKLNATSET